MWLIFLSKFVWQKSTPCDWSPYSLQPTQSYGFKINMCLTTKCRRHVPSSYLLLFLFLILIWILFVIVFKYILEDVIRNFHLENFQLYFKLLDFVLHELEYSMQIEIWEYFCEAVGSISLHEFVSILTRKL